MRAWRAVRAAMPRCLLAGCLGRWGPLGTPGLVLPSGVNQTVRAGWPFVEHDPGGASLVCISNRDGRVLPPYVMIDVPTPLPALASNPPSVAGSL